MKKVAVVFVHSDAKKYPTATIEFELALGKRPHQVDVVPQLPHSIMIFLSSRVSGIARTLQEPLGW